MELEFF